MFSSFLQSSVSHDLHQIIVICWFAAQETFLIIFNVENSHAAKYLVENSDTFVQNSLMNKMFKRIASIWNLFGSKSKKIFFVTM